MIRGHSAPGLSFADLAARFLVVAAGLSLNDLFSRAFGVGQVASPGMFLAAAVLLLRLNTRALGWPTILFLGTIASYLGLGLLFSAIHNDIESAIPYCYMYLASAAVTLGVVNYVATTEHTEKLHSFILFTRNVYAISAAFILASPLLEKVLDQGAYANDGRFRGLFSNPNEASYVGIFGWILCTVFPFKDRRLQIVAASGIAAGVACTLSKGGIVVLVALMLYQAFDLRKPKRTAIVTFLAAIGLVVIQNIQYLTMQILAQYSGVLSSSQTIRIVQITGILGGQINSETSTGRTVLWNLSLERFADNFPLGGGLGSFHFLVGGIGEGGVWQGAHNLYLMMLGEAGPIPLLFLLLMGGISVAKAFSLPERFRHLLLLLWITLGLQALTSHGTLELRHILLVVALALGLTIRLAPNRLARRASRSWQRSSLAPRSASSPTPQAVGARAVDP